MNTTNCIEASNNLLWASRFMPCRHSEKRLKRWTHEYSVCLNENNCQLTDMPIRNISKHNGETHYIKNGSIPNSWTVLWKSNQLCFFGKIVMLIQMLSSGTSVQAHGFDGGSQPQKSVCKCSHLPYQLHLSEQWLWDLPVCRWPSPQPMEFGDHWSQL